MKIGTAIWPWHWAAPYESALDRISQAGFKAVELIAWGYQVLEEYYTPQKVKELRALLDDKGLELSEFVVSTWTMASPEKSQRDAGIENFKRGIEVASELGTGLINSVTAWPFGMWLPWITQRPHAQVFGSGVPSGLDWKQNYQDYVDAVGRVCELAEKAGLRYALEPHPFGYVANAAAMLWLIEQVGSPALGMNLDPSHLFPCGEFPEIVVYRLADRIFHCHFSDNDGVTNAHWRPGKGKIDWEAVMRALKDVGFDGVISIELEDVPGVSSGEVAGIENLPGVQRIRRDATPEFAQEVVRSKEYIKQLGVDLGISID